MNRHATPPQPRLPHPTAVHALKIFLTLGFLYLGIEFIGLFVYRVEFFDSWPLIWAILQDAALHGTITVRVGLGVMTLAACLGLSKLFERR